MARPRSPSPSSDEAPRPSKTRRVRDVSVDPTKLPPRGRKPSEKQAEIDKENLDSMQAKFIAMQKQIQKQKKLVATAAAQKAKADADDDDDDGFESEERMSEVDESVVAFSTAITPRAPLPPPPPRPKPILRKALAKSTEPKTTARAFIKIPEPTAAQRALDSAPSPPASPGPDIDMDDEDPRVQHPLPPSSPLPRSSSPSEGSSDRSRSSGKRARSRESSPPPPPKRAKAKLEAKFREGFMLVPGTKPKASDYASIPHSLILRACADYSARILAVDAFPAVGLQTQWSQEAFRGACRSARGERYVLTDRITKIITARGSQVRGKIVEAYRAQFAGHYGLERSASKKVIETNRQKAEDLKHKASFHYKNPKIRQGFGENKIIGSVRRLTTFRDAVSLGVLFPSFFNPISLPYTAFDFAVLEFCSDEWSTGSFVQAKFTEKAVALRYRAHLSDVEKWNALSPTVVENIRGNWYKRASQTLLTPATGSVLSTNINEDEEEALRNELAGRSGDTDAEDDVEADGGA
ncbi:hypothetical protein C8R46DRAFT_1209558 [Mycena filopes]|nr:hypothetical protein C8R46DRAFT_1209558 [Mycena filopes]